jgi:hypothetical protein
VQLYGWTITIEEFPYEPFKINYDKPNAIPLYQNSIQFVFKVNYPDDESLPYVREIIERYKPAGTHPEYVKLVPPGGGPR